MPEPTLDDVLLKSAEDFASDAADARIRRHRMRLGDDPEFLVYEGRDCTIFGRPPVFGFFEDKRFNSLAESVNHDEHAERAFYRAMVSVAGHWANMELIGPCCLLDNEWSRNVWHWFTEYVPKVLMLERFGFDGTYVIPADLSYAGESLSLLGIDPARVVPYTQEGLVAKRLTFTQAIPGRGLPQYPTLVDQLRRAFLGRYETPPPMRRLYLARRDARRVVNEDELMRVLEPLGFTRVYLEDHSLEEQIWFASNAEIVLGPHGAAMVFTMFMPPGGLVVELFSPYYVSPTIAEMCGLLGHEYHMVPARCGPPEGYKFGEGIWAFLEAIAAIVGRWPDRASRLPDARSVVYRLGTTTR